MSSTQQKPTVKSENFRNISKQVLRFVCVSHLSGHASAILKL